MIAPERFVLIIQPLLHKIVEFNLHLEILDHLLPDRCSQLRLVEVLVSQGAICGDPLWNENHLVSGKFAAIGIPRQIDQI